MLNICAQTGRFTRDPELRYTQSGKAVASFSLAVDRDYVNKETGKRETDFLEYFAWDKIADFIVKNFHKGNLVTVEGRLESRSYVDRDGNKRHSVEIKVDHIYFGESKKSAPPEAENEHDGELPS